MKYKIPIGMFGSEDGKKILQKIKESINESQPFADFTTIPKTIKRPTRIS